MKLTFTGALGKVEPLGERYPGWLNCYVWIAGCQPGFQTAYRELIALHLRAEQLRGLLPGDKVTATVTLDFEPHRPDDSCLPKETT
jgi:hypothetical protein